MIDHTNIFSGGTVDMYDGSVDTATLVHDAGARRVTLYTRESSDANNGPTVVRPYHILTEATDCIARVCMLDNRAIKILIAMYPSAPHYVLVRLAFRSSWLLGIIGLMRRWMFGLVRIEGVTALRGSDGKRTFWLVLEQSGGAVHHIPVLPKSVGVPAFLTWLRDEQISYIVLRFYEQLPELHRQAGDLDVLVSDTDKPKVEAFLQRHEEQADGLSEDIRIGLHSVSGEPGMIPYYPPPLARQMLQGAVDGPANSRIPAPEDALHSFIYHGLYHSKKGYASGIPSSLSTHIDQYPENDYSGTIQRMASELDIEVGETMEELDEYMARVGWRPKLDTLAKIAETNAWVRDRFFSSVEHDTAGLAVFVLREWVRDHGRTEDVLAHIKMHGYTIIRSKTLTKDEQDRVANMLRGGTWGANADGSTDGWLPAVVVVVVDKACAKLPPAYAVGFEQYRVRNVKEELRQKFDSGGMSSMHSTDNTRESWEYIEVCFPDEVTEIRDEVASYMAPSRLATWRHILRPAYLKHSIKHSMRSFVIRRFLS
ncbi:MAG: hypothetical protein WDZ93_00785 [Candidatus Paceibacterota bacterium]